MYSLEKLQRCKVKDLRALLEFEGKTIPKKAKKRDLIDLVLQQSLPRIAEGLEDLPPASVRIQRIRKSQE